ncbi:hypothetical protein [Moheibacter lacus]|uniref:Addiction module component n=1 Tax=Moheibacter lacus TaxID=2745851 RepID=A0A838ZLP1_9FLAO|nr:hypothetical protein [Moheibacter lacus]MBA5628466.1 hypothetical protein [Moheibacter lacus]
MDIQADIKWIQNELSNVNDPDLIEAFKRLLQFRKKTETFTLEQYNLELKEAENRIEQDNYLTQEQVEKRLRGS